MLPNTAVVRIISIIVIYQAPKQARKSKHRQKVDAIKDKTYIYTTAKWLLIIIIFFSSLCCTDAAANNLNTVFLNKVLYTAIGMIHRVKYYHHLELYLWWFFFLFSSRIRIYLCGDFFFAELEVRKRSWRCVNEL